MKQGFRMWKRRKQWVYASTALAILAGGGVVTTVLPNVIPIVFAQNDIVNGKQIGELNGKPVIQATSTDMDSEEFQALVDSILANSNVDGIRYVVDSVGWTDKTDVVGTGVGAIGQTLSTSHVGFLGADGFNRNDKGAYVNPQDVFRVTNVGTATDLQTNEKINIDLVVTYENSEHGPDGNGNDKTAAMAIKNQSGVITVGFGVNAKAGASNAGGITEGGTGGSGGTGQGRLAGWIEQVRFTTVLVNSETGEVLPTNETVMAMKLSDVDAMQRATTSSDTYAYLLSPDTNLTPQGEGFVTTTNVATNPDTTQLSPTSYVAIMRGSMASVEYKYTDSRGDHLTIVAGIFGNTGFELNVDKTGSIIIDKSGDLTNKTMWNDKYSLAGNEFKLTNKETGETFTAKTDETGKAIATDLPFGTYTVEEVSASNGFVKTFETKEVTIDMDTPKQTVGDKEDQVVTVTGTNKEIVGQTALVKQDKDTKEQSQGKGTLKSAQYQLFHGETNEPVKWSDNPAPTLLKGEKVTESKVNGKTVSHGDNVVIDVDDESLEASVGNLPLGRYYWKEVNAPEGYAIDGSKHEFTIDKVDDTQQVVTADKKESNESVIKARVSLQKLLQQSNDLNASGYNDIQFTFTPVGNTKAEAKTVTTGIKDDEDGFASVELEYGDWVINEVNAPEGYKAIDPIYIHMSTNEETDVITITASHNEDGSSPFSKRTFTQSDDDTAKNENVEGSLAGVVSSGNAFISLSRLTFKNNTVEPDNDDFQPEKYVLNTKAFDIKGLMLLDDDNELSDRYKDTNGDPYVDKKDNNESENINTDILSRGDNIYYQVWLDTNNFEQDDKFTKLGITDTFSEYFTVSDTSEIKVYDKQTGADVTEYFDISVNERELTVQVNETGKKDGIVDTEKVAFGRYYVIDIPGHVSQDTPSETDIENVASQFVERPEGDTPTGTTPRTDKPTQKRVNKVREREFEPHKFVLDKADFDITGNSLLDDDGELSDRYKDTNSNPYADKTDNNESNNLNTKLVEKQQALTYQLWLDTTPYGQNSRLTALGMKDDFDEANLDVSSMNITIKDGVDGKNVTEYFDVTVVDGVLTVTVNDKAKKTVTLGDKEVSIVDTEKLPLGRYYKIDFTVNVSNDAKSDTDIVNTASQFVTTVNGNGEETPVEKETEKRVNKLKSENPVQSFLPHTGDSSVVWWAKLIGWLSAIGGASYFGIKKYADKSKK